MIEMVTTIQLKEPTKQDLFKIKNQLEAIFGSSLSYDEVISYLIKESQISTPAKRSFKKFKGILGSEGRKTYRLMREEELANERK